VVLVTLRFDVRDKDRTKSALSAELCLKGDNDTWSWSAGEPLLGTLVLEGSQLTVETNSISRADRGRQLIERIAKDAVVYRGREQVDVKEELENTIRSGKWPKGQREEVQSIPLEVQDELFQRIMAKHNTQWLDDQIPVLEHHTPRFAATSARLRPRLVGLLKNMENDYLRSLSHGEPAFDPTWMWAE